MKVSEPDPLDEYDHRVLVEWTDKLGQAIRPGDYVAMNNYRALSIGKVVMIRAKRKDGRSFSNKKPHMLLHLCDLNKMELSYYDRNTYDPILRQYTGVMEKIPNTAEQREIHTHIVRVDWKPASEL